MVALQLLSHNTGLARCRDSEIMGQLELAVVVSLRSNQFLHDLQQSTGRIFGHGTVRGIEHLVPQCPQGADALILFAGFKRLQQMDDGISDAQPPGFSQFLYAVRVEMGVKPAFIDIPDFYPGSTRH